MSKLTIYNIEGKEVGTMELPAIFSQPVDEKLIHRYVTWVRTMLRGVVAHTKGRGDVAGGGKKPWRQKGTGRARVGSTRSPLWRHGGIVFGPNKEQTYATRMPRGERRKAFLAALSAKAGAEKVIILDELALKAPKTAAMAAILNALPSNGKKVLHIHGEEHLANFVSLRNLPLAHATTVEQLNVLDVMNHDYLLLTKDGVAALQQHFTFDS
jgi:large subunit ribosomal protein L4